MALFADVFQFIYEECPGAPEPAMQRAVISAAQELARDSRVISDWLDDIPIVSGQDVYEVELDDAYRLVSVIDAKIGGTPPVRGIGIYTTQSDGADAVRLVPVPSGDSMLTLRVTSAPGIDSTTLRDDLFDTYGEVIACGAKARLQLQVGKPWSNPQAAAVNQGRFNAGKNVARVRANRDGAGELMVMMRKV